MYDRSINDTWKEAIIKSLDISLNYKEFKENLISIMDFPKINVTGNKEDFITVAGVKHHISNFEIPEYQTKADIVKKFQENRKKRKKSITYKNSGSELIIR